MITKICKRCKVDKPVTEFGPHSVRPDGLQGECVPCRRYMVRQSHKRCKKTDPLYDRKRNIHKLYGLSLEAFNTIIEQQGDRCMICKETFKTTPHIDHSHETGKLRGVLCGKCNIGLGQFKDNIDILESAIKYLAQSKL